MFQLFKNIIHYDKPFFKEYNSKGFGSTFQGIPDYSSADLDFIKQVLIKEFDAFPDRHVSVILEALIDGWFLGLDQTHSVAWQSSRKLFDRQRRRRMAQNPPTLHPRIHVRKNEEAAALDESLRQRTLRLLGTLCRRRQTRRFEGVRKPHLIVPLKAILHFQHLFKVNHECHRPMCVCIWFQ